MQELPVIYYSSQKAWFNAQIFSDWFFNNFVPEVRKYQAEVLKIAPENIKAILILDNAPAHPSIEKLCSRDGRIKCLMLPPNTISLIQPMDQGINLACKRMYPKKFLDEVMVVLEDEADKETDTRGQ